MDITTLTGRIQRNIPLDFGDIFSKSIDLFKKTWLQGFLFIILSIVVALPALLIIYVPFFGVIARQEFMYQEYGATDFSIFTMLPFIILFIVALILLNSITFAMTAGFFKTIKKLDDGEEASTADLFMYVKGNYLKKSFILSLITIGISLLATLLCVLPLLYVMVPVNFVAAVFAFNPELSPSEVIRASFMLGNKKWLIAFGLIIVSSILAEIVGLILCFIGVFFTASFVYLPIYLIYKQAVGFETYERPAERPLD